MRPIRWRCGIDDRDKPLKGLLILLLFLLPSLMAPIPATASPAGSVPVGGHVGATTRSTPLHQAKSSAILTLTQTTDPRGRIRLVATSNARYVVVVYRAGNRANRKVTVRIRHGLARVTLPAGSTGILAQTKSTSRLTPSPLAVATPSLLPTPAPRRASPGPVTGTSVSAVSQDSITLSWANPRDRDLQAVVVYQAGGTPGPGQPYHHVTVLPRSATSFADTGLAANMTYTYVIVPVDRDLNAGAAVRLTSSTLPDTTPPGPVAAVTLVRVNHNSLEFIWLDPPPVRDLKGFQVRRAIGATPPATVADGTLMLDPPATAMKRFIDTGLTPGTQYSYSVFALDFVGNASTPVSVTITTTAWAVISAGEGHTCALDTRGAAWCWGDGYLSNGKVGGSSIPVRVAGGLTFTSLTVGARHVCALDPVGAAWCWGDDTEGALGDGPAAISHTEPVAVTGGHLFATVAAGDKHTCGLDRSGSAWCWGDNSVGSLGSGTLTNSFSPVAVVGGHTFTRLTAGDQRTCAVDTAGAAWCWGLDVQMVGDFGRITANPTPVAVPGGHVFTNMATEWGATCGVDTSGITWCWGMNVSGGMGDGIFGGYRPTPVRVVGDQTFRTLTSGRDRMCGLDVTGAAWCWGAVLLGDGTGNSSSVPVAVIGGLTFSNLDAGYGQTCGVDTSGKAWCWGYNARTEIGDGSAVDRRAPVEVSSPIN